MCPGITHALPFPFWKIILHITGHCPSSAAPLLWLAYQLNQNKMSKEIHMNRTGKQSTVFYYNFLQAAYQREAFGNTKVFPKYQRCTNKTLLSSRPLMSTVRRGAPPCGHKRPSSTSSSTFKCCMLLYTLIPAFHQSTSINKSSNKV